MGKSIRNAVGNRERKMKLGLLNGPNLNLLGKREPEVYGNFTLDEIELRLKEMIRLSGLSAELISYQSNVEGELINFIHRVSQEGVRYLIFNPGAYTHTSIALHDAIAGTRIKVVEVHISNIHQRESYREHSYIASVAIGQIVGLGIASYELALTYLLNVMREEQE